MKKTYSQGGQDLFVLSFFDNNYKGTFVDIGCYLPEHINNTLLLEEQGWCGVSLDIQDLSNDWKIRRSPFICGNALHYNYKPLFIKYNMPKVIDYLSLDIEGNGDRFLALKRVFEFGYEFKIITIEHDAYRKYEETERTPQREFLLKKGYFLLCSNVSLVANTPYEDWWINSKYLDINNYQYLLSDNLLYTEILERIEKNIKIRKNNIEDIKYKKWIEAQKSESKHHVEKFDTTLNDRAGIEHYNLYMNYFKLLGLNIDIKEQSVLEIGPGKIAALCFCKNYGKSYIIEPLILEDTFDYYKSKNITVINEPAETSEIVKVNQVWLFNVLQHVIDPFILIEKIKKCGEIIYFFEPIDCPTDDKHIHILTEEFFVNVFNRESVNRYRGNSIKNFHTADCAYGKYIII